MMPRTLFLHIGAGKTGTSAIQAALPLVRETLSEHGIIYPRDITVSEESAQKGHVSSGNAVTLARIANPNSPRPKNYDIQHAFTWLQDILKQAEASGKNVLFSSEALQFVGQPGLVSLSEMFRARGFSVVVIYYIRTAIDYSLSTYLQHLKRGFPKSDFPRTLQSYIATTRVPYRQTLADYFAVFGEVNVRIYNYDQVKKSLVKSFLQPLVGNIDIPVVDKRINRSLTAYEQMCFERLMTSSSGQSKCALLGNILMKDSESNPSHSRYFISREALDAYQSNNQSIVDYVNTYLPAGVQPIQVTTDTSPITTSQDEVSISEIHSTYCKIIAQLIDAV